MTTLPLIAGIGLSSAAITADILELVRLAMEQANRPKAALQALATVASLARHPALSRAASDLGVAVLAVEAQLLQAQTAIRTSSPRSQAAWGVGSVAEAAALAAAGPGSRLIVGRLSLGRATCALAGDAHP